MKATLPDIDLLPGFVAKNRDTIKAARSKCHALLKALDGLDAANAAMCDHSDKVERYDPGYAGGGYSHSECPQCGARLP